MTVCNKYVEGIDRIVVYRVLPAHSGLGGEYCGQPPFRDILLGLLCDFVPLRVYEQLVRSRADYLSVKRAVGQAKKKLQAEPGRGSPIIIVKIRRILRSVNKTSQYPNMEAILELVKNYNGTMHILK